MHVLPRQKLNGCYGAQREAAGSHNGSLCSEVCAPRSLRNNGVHEDFRDFSDYSILEAFGSTLEFSLRGQLTESGLYMGTSL